MKYEGLILEGRWKAVSMTDTHTYVFENIYNDNTITLTHYQIERVLNGKDTIGHIMTRKAPNHEMFKYGNNIQKNWKRQKYKYLKKSKKV